MITLYHSPGTAGMVVHWLLLELEVPHRIREDLEDVVSGGADPAGYSHGLVVGIGHGQVSFPEGPPPDVRASALTT